jgi:competence protein ComEC
MRLRWRGVWVAMVLLGGLAVGSDRGGIYNQQQHIYASYIGKSMTISATVLNDAVYDSKYQLVCNATHIRLANGRTLVGQIQVGGFGAPALFAGDTIQITGKLRPAYGSGQASMSFARITVLAHHSSYISTVRRNFAAGLQSALPEPTASFALGILIGQRSTLPKINKTELLMVGLTHIIAVSGYNLTILVIAMRRVSGRHSKRISFGLAFSTIVFFVMLTGSSASIMRAAIVSTLSITAGYYGRKVKPLLLILIAATVTAYITPFYIWGDASWYLSFLAFFGILVVAPLLEVRWKAKNIIILLVIETIAAELMTIPYILMTFGQISPISLVANVMVVALVPLAMLLSAIAGVAGMMTPMFAGWVAWPATICLTYMLDTAHLLSRIPHSFLNNLSLALGPMLFLYAVLLVFVMLLSRRTHQFKYGKITDITLIPKQGATK